jgi:hypothetical protein
METISLRASEAAGGGRADSVWPQIQAALMRRRLDAELARGADPAGRPGLAARAHRLRTQRSREDMAAAIEDVIREADRPPRLSAAAPINRPAIRAARAELTDLAQQVRARPDAPARGLALVRLMVMDGASPLYGREPAEALLVTVGEARRALLGVGR